jgi:N-acetylneuraminic acid mutarotase
MSTGRYWNGATWGAGTSQLAPTTYNAGTGAWDRTAALPGGADLPEGDYRVCVSVYDNAGGTPTTQPCSTITVNQRPYVTSTLPLNGGIVARSHNSVTIRLSEAVYRCTNVALACTSTATGLTLLAGSDYGSLFTVEDSTAPGVPVSATAVVNTTTFTITITLNPNPANPSSTPLAENRTYNIIARSCAVTPCANGIVDAKGVALGDSAGNLVATDTRSFRTPDPVNLPVSTSTTWSGPPPGPISLMTPGRRDVAAGTGNGYFFVTGGIAADGATMLADNLRYNPATDQWGSVAAMPGARYAHAAVTVGNSVYVFGGIGPNGTLNQALVYNAVTNSWSTLPNMPAARRYLAAAAVDNKIYVAGGYDSSGVIRSEVYRFDLGTNTWSQVTTLPFGGNGRRAKLTLTATGSGATAKLWAIGGVGPFNTEGTRVEVYDVTANTWTNGTALPQARNLHGTMVLNGYLYVMGGLDAASTPQDEVWVIDPIDGPASAWTAVNAASVLPAEGRAAFGGNVAVLDSASGISGILIAGGRTTTSAGTDSVLASQHG